MPKKLTYAQAGVNRAAADQLVEKITGLTRATLNRKVKSSVGGYASLYELDSKRLLAASTDGVGTKLKLAFELDRHDTVGIDLVAMSVNDLICTGAEPLFFLDYFATGKLQKGIAEKVIAGIAEGCRQARCALVGGETAEMPDFYSKGEYDLAGFAVGLAEKKNILPRKDVRPGDALIGIASSGFHSNGYSLLRKLLPRSGTERKKRARELLTPTKIYVSSVLPLLKLRRLKGLAHITGSGFLNIPRISEKVSYVIELPAQKQLPPVIEWIRGQSGLPLQELSQTFNMGVGLVAVVAQNQVSDTLKKLKASGEKAWEIGEVQPRRRGRKAEVSVRDAASSIHKESALLKY